MQKKHQAFSLVEVMIASFILTISVFGIYKLIGENSKIIQWNDRLMQAEMLLKNTTNCIDALWFTDFKNSSETDYSFNFWSDGLSCITWAYLPNLSFSWVSLDASTYFLYGTITNSGSNFIDWEIKVYEEQLGEKKLEYTQLPY